MHTKMEFVLPQDWSGMARLLIVAPAAYVTLIVVLRLSGKRVLSKMNAFDLIVTVALGSALSTTILSKDTALVEGMAALALLVLLQFCVTWLSVRSDRFQSFVKAKPTLLYHRGQAFRHAMSVERVTYDEVLAAIRSSGMAELSNECSVVLETDGSLSIVAGSVASEQRSSLANVTRIVAR